MLKNPYILISIFMCGHTYANDAFMGNINNTVFEEAFSESKINDGKISNHLFKNLQIEIEKEKIKHEKIMISDKIKEASVSSLLSSPVGKNTLDSSEVLSLIKLSLPDQEINEVKEVLVPSPYVSFIPIALKFTNGKTHLIENNFPTGSSLFQEPTINNPDDISLNDFLSPSTGSVSFGLPITGDLFGLPRTGHTSSELPGTGDPVVQNPEPGVTTLATINSGDPILSLPRCGGGCGPSACWSRSWHLWKKVYYIKNDKHVCSH